MVEKLFFEEDSQVMIQKLVLKWPLKRRWENEEKNGSPFSLNQPYNL